MSHDPPHADPPPLDPPPPARRHESAAAFHARGGYLEAVAAPKDGWAARGAGDIAYMMEALGLTADVFEEVLRLAHAATPLHMPAGLHAGGYRFVIFPPERVYAEPLGLYLGYVVAARVETPR